jgi:hypothetical protein
MHHGMCRIWSSDKIFNSHQLKRKSTDSAPNTGTASTYMQQPHSSPHGTTRPQATETSAHQSAHLRNMLFNKIVNNYWNSVALDGNPWTWSTTYFSTSLCSHVKLYYDQRSVGQYVLVSGTPFGPATNFSSFYKLFLDSYTFNDARRPLWREVGSVVLSRAHFIDSIFGTPPTWRVVFLYIFRRRNRVAQLYPRALGMSIARYFCSSN